MITASFNGHDGYYDPENGNVVFYGLRYRNIDSARWYMQNLSPGKYDTWFFMGFCGLVDEKGYVYVDARWLPSKAIAEIYLMNKKSSPST